MSATASTGLARSCAYSTAGIFQFLKTLCWPRMTHHRGTRGGSSTEVISSEPVAHTRSLGLIGVFACAVSFSALAFGIWNWTPTDHRDASHLPCPWTAIPQRRARRQRGRTTWNPGSESAMLFEKEEIRDTAESRRAVRLVRGRHAPSNSFRRRFRKPPISATRLLSRLQPKQTDHLCLEASHRSTGNRFRIRSITPPEMLLPCAKATSRLPEYSASTGVSIIRGAPGRIRSSGKK